MRNAIKKSPLNRNIWLFIFSFMINLPAFSQSKSEAVVNKLQYQLFAALVNKDFSFLQSIFSDKLEYCRSNGVINTKTQYLETIRSGEVTYTELNAVSVKTRQYAGNVVINRGTVKIAVKAANNDGKPYLLYFTSVYIKGKSGWKIVSIQSTKVLD